MGWLRDAFRRPPLLHVATDAGSGPPVIMIHGIASSSVTFERLVPLVEPHHRVIAIDLLGFGESPAPEDAEYTIAEHTAALTRTIAALKLREPFVLSLQNSIETQTTLTDLAAVRVPVEVVYGSLDPFLAPSGLRVVEQLRNVTTHRVEGGDHVIRSRMARVVVTAIG